MHLLAMKRFEISGFEARNFAVLKTRASSLLKSVISEHKLQTEIIVIVFLLIYNLMPTEVHNLADTQKLGYGLDIREILRSRFEVTRK